MVRVMDFAPSLLLARTSAVQRSHKRGGAKRTYSTPCGVRSGGRWESPRWWSRWASTRCRRWSGSSSTEMTTMRQGERGSAMVEAAIIFPCLVLILYWSAALTDVMVLKLKAAEALRYTLWESTVFKAPQRIDAEVQQRFVDLRSPKSLDLSYTRLLMYPLAADMAWKANLDTTSTRVSMSGNRIPPSGTRGLLDAVMNLIANGLSSAVGPALRFFNFNMNREAASPLTLHPARHPATTH